MYWSRTRIAARLRRHGRPPRPEPQPSFPFSATGAENFLPSGSDTLGFSAVNLPIVRPTTAHQAALLGALHGDSLHRALRPYRPGKRQCRFVIHRLAEQDHGKGSVAWGCHVPVSLGHGLTPRHDLALSDFVARISCTPSIRAETCSAGSSA